MNIRGELGAVHCKMEKSEIQYNSQMLKGNNEDNHSTLMKTPRLTIELVERHENWVRIVLQTTTIDNSEGDGCRGILIETFKYILCMVGPPKDINIVDTTGSGDAFVAGYLFSQIVLERMGRENEAQQVRSLSKSESSSSSNLLLKTDDT